jgi:hypothetical protein
MAQDAVRLIAGLRSRRRAVRRLPGRQPASAGRRDRPDTIRILDGGRLVASHPILEGRRQYRIDPDHRQGTAQADQAALDAVEGRDGTGCGAAHRWPPIPPASRSPIDGLAALDVILTEELTLRENRRVKTALLVARLTT